MTSSELFIDIAKEGLQSSRLKDVGVNITIGTSLNDYRNSIDVSSRGYPVTSAFDDKEHPIEHSDCLFIIGENKCGEVVHTQALRLIDLDNMTLSEYLGSNFLGFRPPSPQMDKALSSYVSGPGASRITGTAVYHGEFWMSPNHGLRGEGLAGHMALIGFWMSYLVWSPSFWFAFILRTVADKGLSVRANWLHHDPDALLWRSLNDGKHFNALMAYLSRDDVVYLAKRCNLVEEKMLSWKLKI